MTEERIVVDYIYKLKTSKVEISYVDTDGNAITNSDTLTGKVFDKYSTKAKDIHGYILTQSPNNASGEMQEGTIKVIYVYTKEQLASKSPKTGNDYIYLYLSSVLFICSMTFVSFYEISKKKKISKR